MPLSDDDVNIWRWSLHWMKTAYNKKNNYRWHFETIKSNSEIRWWGWWWCGLLFQLLFPSIDYGEARDFSSSLVMKHEFMSMVCAGNKKILCSFYNLIHACMSLTSLNLFFHIINFLTMTNFPRVLSIVNSLIFFFAEFLLSFLIQLCVLPLHQNISWESVVT